MSIMDTAQLLGNLGEFIGSIVIIATLIYLAMQVRQNTNALRIQSRQSVLSGAQTELLAVLENPDVFTSMVKSEPFTQEETVKLNVWLMAAMRLREFSWLQYQSGVIDEAQWSTERHVIQILLSASRTRAWWEKSGRIAFGAPFIEFIDDLLRDQPITDYPFEIATDWTNR
jgi:hypothetical protein